ncbi:MAG: hypothetical protein EXR18_03635 [Flavobacteriaceae bacterium]|nr:hypothetical protein [Flavobacteriaceae bacterium]
MKIKFLLSFAVLTLLFSCSSDSNSGTDSSTQTNYFPLALRNYWKYRVLTNTITQTDSLYVSNDTTINTKVYKKFKTRNTPIGFFSNSMNKNALRIDGFRLLLTGSLGFNFGTALPINLSLSDYVIFQENASNNQELGSVLGVINQTVQNYPLVINYTLKTTNIESLATFSSNGRVYSDVKKIKTVLNAKITTSITLAGIPFPVVVSILDPQDVVTSYQYYSKTIGNVYTNTTINYRLNALPAGITLPLPTTGNQTQEEFLQSYDVSH